MHLFSIQYMDGQGIPYGVGHSFKTWHDRPGHAQPIVFVTRDSAEAYLDELRHCEAKRLEVVEYAPAAAK